MVLFIIFAILVLFYPLIFGGYVQRDFLRTSLSNDIGYADADQNDTFWNKYITEPHKSTPRFDAVEWINSTRVDVFDNISC
jgi:hypothetical protein